MKTFAPCTVAIAATLVACTPAAPEGQGAGPANSDAAYAAQPDVVEMVAAEWDASMAYLETDDGVAACDMAFEQMVEAQPQSCGAEGACATEPPVLFRAAEESGWYVSPASLDELVNETEGAVEIMLCEGMHPADLVIDRPVTIQGEPGAVIEPVGGAYGQPIFDIFDGGMLTIRPASGAIDQRTSHTRPDPTAFDLSGAIEPATLPVIEVNPGAIATSVYEPMGPGVVMGFAMNDRIEPYAMCMDAVNIPRRCERM